MSVNTLSKPESLSRFVEALQARTTVARDTSDQDERLGRSLAQRMSGDLGPDIAGLAKFHFESATRTELGAWHAEQPGQGLMVRCMTGVEDEQTPALLATMEMQSVRDVATLLLGGTVSANADKGDKPLTRIEQSICDMLWRDLIVAVGKETKHEIGVPDLCRPAEVDLTAVKDKRVLVMQFTVKVGERDSMMQLAIPADRLPVNIPAAPPAAAAGAAAKASGHDEGGPKFGSLRVEATIRLSGGMLTYRQIEEMEVGSVLPLADAAFSNCIMQVGQEVLATARVGKSGDHYCIRINDDSAN
ncbi:FliM/FliN family flagellar motor switch protein [Notoacmeibacter sp. MSK16QG-6]|uniref:FliM/FliN family flagellar motor switch protein n=1 Tax=Notoacmeibacter sp. MSK16QG-6 TaxID=2957982 RepID=UPI00209FDDD2|nr:FliM/FliN family flagellar motor switch protein [Notoacmeibacter sp. MSK16QG-6]MCP1200907.1 FliM/FliN family flagellar motor switch protein [Notoacmeibacter sp. MSK16QG-6]